MTRRECTRRSGSKTEVRDEKLKTVSPLRGWVFVCFVAKEGYPESCAFVSFFTFTFTFTSTSTSTSTSTRGPFSPELGFCIEFSYLFRLFSLVIPNEV